ncbi:translation initiation factor IF-2, partial [Peptoniphilus asaccharolyticus]
MSKIRVHALAKELNLSSKDLLQKMEELKIDVKNHMSTLEPEDEQKIRNVYQPKTEQKTETTDNKKPNVNDNSNKKHIGKTNHQQNKNKDMDKSGQKQLNKNFDNKKNKEVKESNKNPNKKHMEKEKVKTEDNNFKNKNKKHKNKKGESEENNNEPNNRRRQRDLTKKTPVKKRSKAQKKQDRIDSIKNDDSPIKIKAPITVKDFAEKLALPVTQIISKLIVLGVMASQNQEIDEDTCILVADELGVEIIIDEPEEEVSIEEKLGLDFEDDEKDLKSRPPVVTVMGHVDHGKTSILDVIKKSHVQESEAGGITQHIGAYTVTVNKKKITFLDTPGHEAFTSMRLRGALITDIAILVVAADDGVMPQTVEAISHAKSAGVPIIVAINKMDKPGANIDRVKQELLENGLMSEDWGGDTIMVPVSAKTKDGIDDLLEMINLVAEIQELKANPNRMAVGTVIEAKLDKGKGPMATVLIQKGTLNFGDTVVSGVASGRIRAMTDDKNRNIKKAGPSMPAVILGLSDVPNAGELIYAVEDEKTARTIADSNREEIRENRINAGSKVSLDNLFARIKEGEMKDLNIVVKADVKGSVEALNQSLLKLSNEEVKINVIHSGVGGINESDVTLAS